MTQVLVLLALYSTCENMRNIRVCMLCFGPESVFSALAPYDFLLCSFYQLPMCEYIFKSPKRHPGISLPRLRASADIPPSSWTVVSSVLFSYRTVALSPGMF
jgi:hypothetical protein